MQYFMQLSTYKTVQRLGKQGFGAVVRA